MTVIGDLSDEGGRSENVKDPQLFRALVESADERGNRTHHPAEQERYLERALPPRDPLLAEMEAVGGREDIRFRPGGRPPARGARPGERRPAHRRGRQPPSATAPSAGARGAGSR